MVRTDAEVAWLAGIFEGEGCFEIAKNGGTRISIGMTDRDVIERVNSLFPCTRISVTDSVQGHKTKYGWRISNPGHVREFIALVQPWLGERRSARAQEVIDHLDTRIGTGGHQKARTHCAEGHEYTPENTYVRPGTDHRHCRTCRTEWARAYRARRAALVA